MEESGCKDQGKKKVYKVTTFPVPFPLEEHQENITIITNTTSIPSQEEIINQAISFHLKGNISKAAKLYKYFIDQGFNDQRVFSNYGDILKNLGKFKEAEILYKKAIEAGATGGKLLGAGAGGFILLAVEPKKRIQVLEAMKEYVHVPFEFDSIGSQVIYSDN